MDEKFCTITLYKYLSVVGLEKFIKEKTIKLSFGYETNDRFEVLRGNLVPKCSSEELEDDFAAGTHIGFISLSEVEENTYMWGYYAEQYRGARLKFQFKVKIERGDDGAESVDEEGGFVVAGRVIGCRLEVCAELFGVGFNGVKEPREVLGGIVRIDACIR